MPGLLPNLDPEGLLEYSVVYTDRSLNHMSASFQAVMRDISSTLKSVYQAEHVAIVPGSGTFAMEAVARQFAQNKKCLVIRNGWFSYRWTQILDTANLASKEIVLTAQQEQDSSTAAFAPAALSEVLETIKTEQPEVVFAPHVETSSGIILPDDYIAQVAAAVHQYGGLFILDCIASGTLWVDMKKLAVDVLISAPQKGWSGSPCSGLVMMNDHAHQQLQSNESNSFACNLKQWLNIMQAYENQGHAYYTTMPTDALVEFHKVMQETAKIGFDKVHQAQLELGQKVRALLAEKGFKSVAAKGFEAPGVVVCYTDDGQINNGRKFLEEGMQIAAGVPLQCNEPEDFQTFRIGLFGLDKLLDVDAAVAKFAQTLDKVLAK